MPDHKRSGDPRPQLANLHKEQLTDLEDVTVLFSPPKELLERTASRDEAKKAAAPTAPTWGDSEDEATLALPLSDALAKLGPQHDEALGIKAASALATPVAVPHGPASSPTAPAPLRPVEIDEDDLGAILGPRRKARLLALGGAVVIVVIAIAIARLSP